jgi:hypothetical protein
MANTQAMTTSFLGEVLTATHNFGTAPTRGSGAADTFKAALYLTSATIDASTTAYSVTGEVSGAGYSAGGVVCYQCNCTNCNQQFNHCGCGLLDAVSFYQLHHGHFEHSV